MRTVEVPARATLALVAAVLLIPLTLGGVHWWHHDRQRRHVAVPAVGSTPVRVAEAYVEAADAHDRATLKAIGEGGLDGLTSVGLIEPPEQAANAPDGDARVGLDLRISGGDASLGSTGRLGWDLYLRKGGPAGWTIVGYGQG